MQLQHSLPDLANRGLGVAAISYDRPETLSAFARVRGITFPLLSDAESATIRRYGILNAEATGRAAGIPHPGTFVVDRQGRVTARSFEASYQERASAASLLPKASGSAPETQAIETAHVRVATSASDRVAAPGTRVSLYVDVAPKPRMHVYAPGQQDLIPIGLTLEPGDGFTAHAPAFPASERYFFAPLNETQLVYSRPFRLVQDVTIGVTPAVRERARSGGMVKVDGSLRYQACDDKLCYAPQTVPVSWTIALRPLER